MRIIVIDNNKNIINIIIGSCFLKKYKLTRTLLTSQLVKCGNTF